MPKARDIFIRFGWQLSRDNPTAKKVNIQPHRDETIQLSVCKRAIHIAIQNMLMASNIVSKWNICPKRERKSRANDKSSQYTPIAKEHEPNDRYTMSSRWQVAFHDYRLVKL